MDCVTEIVRVINNARDCEQSGEINKQAKEDMFNGLLSTVPTFPQEMEFSRRRQIWEGNLIHGEDAWCEENFGHLKDWAQHQRGKRVGQWKYRTILPDPYTSAKNVIGVAIERGVDVAGKGKSAINTASQKAKASAEGDALDAGGKFKKLIDKAAKLYSEASGVDQETMLEYIRNSFPV